MMKKSGSRARLVWTLSFPALFLLAPSFVFATTNPSPLAITKASCEKEKNGESRLVMHIRATPESLRKHIDHYHVFIDGRMVIMFTMTTPKRTVVVDHLHSGEHQIWIIAADRETHKILGRSPDARHDKEMPGMDMGNMEMSSGDSALSGIPTHARVTAFRIKAP